MISTIVLEGHTKEHQLQQKTLAQVEHQLLLWQQKILAEVEHQRMTLIGLILLKVLAEENASRKHITNLQPTSLWEVFQYWIVILLVFFEL